MEKRLVTASERKSLEKLLVEDFELVRVDLRRMAEEARRNGHEEARKAQAKHVAKARTAEDKLRQQMRVLEDEGFKVSVRGYDNREIKVESNTLAQSLHQVDTETNTNLSDAIRILAVREHQAKRDLLRATISDAAIELLDGLPSAESVMRQAVEARKEKAAALTA